MAARRKPAPFLANGPKPNHVQLLHIQRSRKVDDPCDECGVSYTDRATYWRVRANIAMDGAYEAVVGNYCSEECAREEYNALRVEISLITGKKPTRREVMFDQVTKAAKDRGK